MLRLNNLHGLASMWAVVGHNLIFHGVKLAGRVFVGHARRSNTTGFIGLCDTDDLLDIEVHTIFIMNNFRRCLTIS